MIGGDLEVLKHDSHCIRDIDWTNLTSDDKLTVEYKNKGCCILVQGSRMYHHVTKVEQAQEDRITLIISMTPKNAFTPDR